jgi:hypothetical protein
LRHSIRSMQLCRFRAAQRPPCPLQGAWFTRPQPSLALMPYRSTVLSDPAIVSSWRFLNEAATAAPPSLSAATYASALPAAQAQQLQQQQQQRPVRTPEDLLAQAERLLAPSPRPPAGVTSADDGTVAEAETAAMPRTAAGHDGEPQQRARSHASGTAGEVGTYHVNFDAYVFPGGGRGGGVGAGAGDAASEATSHGDSPSPTADADVPESGDAAEGANNSRTFAGVGGGYGAVGGAVASGRHGRGGGVADWRGAGEGNGGRSAVEALPPIATAAPVPSPAVAVDSSFTFSPRARRRPPRYGAWYLPARSWRVGGTREPPQRLTEEQKRHIETIKKTRQKIADDFNRPNGQYFRARYKEFCERKNAHIPACILKD